MSESASRPASPATAQDANLQRTTTPTENDTQTTARVPAVVSRPGAAMASRLHNTTKSALSELRFVSERPSSLHDLIAYAKAGEWTHEHDGRRRHLALAFVYVVAIPISALAYFTAWAAARPGRFASTLAITGAVSTALNAIPVINWFIPDWMTLPYWPPFSWIF